MHVIWCSPPQMVKEWFLSSVNSSSGCSLSISGSSDSPWRLDMPWENKKPLAWRGDPAKCMLLSRKESLHTKTHPGVTFLLSLPPLKVALFFKKVSLCWFEIVFECRSCWNSMEMWIIPGTCDLHEYHSMYGSISWEVCHFSECAGRNKVLLSVIGPDGTALAVTLFDYEEFLAFSLKL